MSSQTPHILLVDDDDLARKLVQRVLTRLRFDVHASPSGAQARQWADERGALDLLITDINLQDESGAALAASLRARFPALPVLYISGYPAPPEPFDEGSIGFLGKPFTPDELAEAVRALIGPSADD